MKDITKLITGTDFYWTNYVKTIEFCSATSLDYISYLNKLTTSHPKCTIMLPFTWQLAVKQRISNHQRMAHSTKVLLFNGPQFELLEFQIKEANHLEMCTSSVAKIQNYLSLALNFSNLKTLDLIDPPLFKLANAISVSNFGLRMLQNRPIEDVFENINTPVIRRLRLNCCKTHLLDALEINASSFVSLESFIVDSVELNNVTYWAYIINLLPCNTLTAVCISPSVLNSLEIQLMRRALALRALLRHKDS
ncbi:hypothetical protein Cantr_07945 [Candida viswanathii]|uniref:Uncharacterized protein n=1 Tax=Candida viswanathii TaxID=5486 RepID=A0A367XZQ8_9ASCO|nr:hypothetical protein Cantr_07945 [Candida viswanathii]